MSIQDDDKKRYLNFIVEYNKTLPANLSDEERKKTLDEALATFVGREVDLLTTELVSELDHLHDQAITEEHVENGGQHPQDLHAMNQIRQALATPAPDALPEI